MKKALLVLSFCFLGWGAFAQSPETPKPEAPDVAEEVVMSLKETGDPEVPPGMSIEQLIETGGPLLYVLFVMSLIGLAFTVYFFFTMRARNFTPPYLYRDIENMVRDGRLHDALDLTRKHRSPSAMVARSGLDYVSRVNKPDNEVLGEIMEGEGARQATAVLNQTQYLMDIGVIAPMVGLLGTVVGMLKSFNAVSLNIAAARPMELAEGVSQALITTAAGLIVGIPAMVAYAYFRGRASSLLADMEIFASNLRSLLVHRDES